VIGLDAGSIATGLSFAEQSRIKAVFISHQHYDHMRDLMLLGLNASLLGTSVDVYGLASTIKAIDEGFFDSFVKHTLYTDPRQRPSADQPAIRLHVLQPLTPIMVDGYSVKATPVLHAVEATGYEVTAPDGHRIFYSGDTGPGVSAAWPHVRPEVMLLECTLDNASDERAQRSVHLQPKTWVKALQEFEMTQGYMPRAVAVHLSPFEEENVRNELPPLAREARIDFAIAHDGEEFEV
jgi:ribonuclease BN (tRNA processing enzyme)